MVDAHSSGSFTFKSVCLLSLELNTSLAGASILVSHFLFLRTLWLVLRHLL